MKTKPEHLIPTPQPLNPKQVGITHGDKTKELLLEKGEGGAGLMWSVPRGRDKLAPRPFVVSQVGSCCCWGVYLWLGVAEWVLRVAYSGVRAACCLVFIACFLVLIACCLLVVAQRNTSEGSQSTPSLTRPPNF